MSEAPVLFEQRGAVALVTLNRPQALNSFTRDMHRELWAAFEKIEADRSVRAAVITGAGRGFCAGADLADFDFEPGADLVKRADPGPIIDQAFNPTVRKLMALRVPTVAAVRGMALGGGCELAVHCARRVVHFESYVGLVEVGVGLIPGAGGLTYIARRAAEQAAAAPGVDLLSFLREGFTAAAMAKVGTSAAESRKLGYLLDSDVIVPHKDEVLHVAIQQVRAMYESSYRAPRKAVFPVAGRSAIATIKAQLVGLRDGGFASAHDYHIASLIADVVCGGEVEAGSMVNEEYLMALERKHFCALLEHPKTQERIMGMLQTGKPVRN